MLIVCVAVSPSGSSRAEIVAAFVGIFARSFHETWVNDAPGVGVTFLVAVSLASNAIALGKVKVTR
jgi:hypothetical protein